MIAKDDKEVSRIAAIGKEAVEAYTVVLGQARLIWQAIREGFGWFWGDGWFHGDSW